MGTNRILARSKTVLISERSVQPLPVKNPEHTKSLPLSGGRLFCAGSGVGAAAAVIREGFHRQGQAGEHQVDAPEGAEGQPPHQGLQDDQDAGHGVQDSSGQHPPGTGGEAFGL